MRRLVWLILIGVLALSGSASAQDRPAARLFSFVGDFGLGPGVNRTDYESVDPEARRLYISKMGGGQLLVFDIANDKLVAQLDGFPKITGVLVVPELHKVYASVPGGGLLSSLSQGLGMTGLSRGHGQVAVLDTRTLREIARLAGGVFPDGIAYDPKARRIFVSDELGGSVTVIDADASKTVNRIDTAGEVGNVRYDPASRNVFVPVQSRNELIRISSSGVTARHVLAGCEHPHGFIVAPKGGVGYVACDENDQLITVELDSGRTLDRQAVAHDPDVLAIDPGMSRLYVAAESGNLSTYNVASPEKPSSLGNVFVGNGAHTVAVDPVSHRLYFALPDLNGHAVMRVLAPKPD